MHAYVSHRPSRFILGDMSALGRVVFIYFHIKKRSKMKKKALKIMKFEKIENKKKAKIN